MSPTDTLELSKYILSLQNHRHVWAWVSCTQYDFIPMYLMKLIRKNIWFRIILQRSAPSWRIRSHLLSFLFLRWVVSIFSQARLPCNLLFTAFPKNYALFAMVCHLTGPSIQQRLYTPFHLVKCSNLRNLGRMFNEIQTKSPLCRSAPEVLFKGNEFPVHTLFEPLGLLCPHRGRVMVPCCRKSTMLIAAIRTARQCMGI